MIKKYNKFIFVLLPVIFLINNFLAFQFCHASTGKEIFNQLDKAGAKGWGEKVETNAMPKMIQIAISTFLGLLGIIFLVLIIYAGYNWMTAGGDEEKVTIAKNTLTRAVIGLIIIVAAYSITYFVFTNLPGGGSGSDLNVTTE